MGNGLGRPSRVGKLVGSSTATVGSSITADYGMRFMLLLLVTWLYCSFSTDHKMLQTLSFNELLRITSTCTVLVIWTMILLECSLPIEVGLSRCEIKLLINDDKMFFL